MRTRVPSYRKRKGYSQALVTFTDAVTGRRRDYWLGEYGTPQSREAYHRIIAQWEAAGRRLPAGDLVGGPFHNHGEPDDHGARPRLLAVGRGACLGGPLGRRPARPTAAPELSQQ